MVLTRRASSTQQNTAQVTNTSRKSLSQARQSSIGVSATQRSTQRTLASTRTPLLLHTLTSTINPTLMRSLTPTLMPISTNTRGSVSGADASPPVRRRLDFINTDTSPGLPTPTPRVNTIDTLSDFDTIIHSAASAVGEGTAVVAAVEVVDMIGTIDVVETDGEGPGGDGISTRGRVVGARGTRVEPLSDVDFNGGDNAGSGRRARGTKRGGSARAERIERGETGEPDSDDKMGIVEEKSVEDASEGGAVMRRGRKSTRTEIPLTQTQTQVLSQTQPHTETPLQTQRQRRTRTLALSPARTQPRTVSPPLTRRQTRSQSRSRSRSQLRSQSRSQPAQSSQTRARSASPREAAVASVAVEDSAEAKTGTVSAVARGAGERGQQERTRRQRGARPERQDTRRAGVIPGGLKQDGIVEKSDGEEAGAETGRAARDRRGTRVQAGSQGTRKSRDSVARGRKRESRDRQGKTTREERADRGESEEKLDIHTRTPHTRSAYARTHDSTSSAKTHAYVRTHSHRPLTAGSTYHTESRKTHRPEFETNYEFPGVNFPVLDPSMAVSAEVDTANIITHAVATPLVPSAAARGYTAPRHSITPGHDATATGRHVVPQYVTEDELTASGRPQRRSRFRGSYAHGGEGERPGEKEELEVLEVAERVAGVRTQARSRTPARGSRRTPSRTRSRTPSRTRVRRGGSASKAAATTSTTNTASSSSSSSSSSASRSTRGNRGGGSGRSNKRSRSLDRSRGGGGASGADIGGGDAVDLTGEDGSDSSSPVTHGRTPASKRLRTIPLTAPRATATLTSITTATPSPPSTPTPPRAAAARLSGMDTEATLTRSMAARATPPRAQQRLDAASLVAEAATSRPTPARARQRLAELLGTMDASQTIPMTTTERIRPHDTAYANLHDMADGADGSLSVRLSDASGRPEVDIMFDLDDLSGFTHLADLSEVALAGATNLLDSGGGLATSTTFDTTTAPVVTISGTHAGTGAADAGTASRSGPRSPPIGSVFATRSAAVSARSPPQSRTVPPGIYAPSPGISTESSGARARSTAGGRAAAVISGRSPASGRVRASADSIGGRSPLGGSVLARYRSLLLTGPEQAEGPPQTQTPAPAHTPLSPLPFPTLPFSLPRSRSRSKSRPQSPPTPPRPSAATEERRATTATPAHRTTEIETGEVGGVDGGDGNDDGGVRADDVYAFEPTTPLLRGRGARTRTTGKKAKEGREGVFGSSGKKTNLGILLDSEEEERHEVESEQEREQEGAALREKEARELMLLASGVSNRVLRGMADVHMHRARREGADARTHAYRARGDVAATHIPSSAGAAAVGDVGAGGGAGADAGLGGTTGEDVASEHVRGRVRVERRRAARLALTSSEEEDGEEEVELDGRRELVAVTAAAAAEQRRERRETERETDLGTAARKGGSPLPGEELEIVDGGGAAAAAEVEVDEEVEIEKEVAVHEVRVVGDLRTREERGADGDGVSVDGVATRIGSSTGAGVDTGVGASAGTGKGASAGTSTFVSTGENAAVGVDMARRLRDEAGRKPREQEEKAARGKEIAEGRWGGQSEVRGASFGVDSESDSVDYLTYIEEWDQRARARQRDWERRQVRQRQRAKEVITELERSGGGRDWAWEATEEIAQRENRGGGRRESPRRLLSVSAPDYRTTTRATAPTPSVLRTTLAPTMSPTAASAASRLSPLLQPTYGHFSPSLPSMSTSASASTASTLAALEAELDQLHHARMLLTAEAPTTRARTFAPAQHTTSTLPSAVGKAPLSSVAALASPFASVLSPIPRIRVPAPSPLPSPAPAMATTATMGAVTPPSSSSAAPRGLLHTPRSERALQLTHTLHALDARADSLVQLSAAVAQGLARAEAEVTARRRQYLRASRRLASSQEECREAEAEVLGGRGVVSVLEEAAEEERRASAARVAAAERLGTAMGVAGRWRKEKEDVDREIEQVAEMRGRVVMALERLIAEREEAERREELSRKEKERRDREEQMRKDLAAKEREEAAKAARVAAEHMRRAEDRREVSAAEEGQLQQRKVAREQRRGEEVKAEVDTADTRSPILRTRTPATTPPTPALPTIATTLAAAPAPALRTPEPVSTAVTPTTPPSRRQLAQSRTRRSLPIPISTTTTTAPISTAATTVTPLISARRSPSPLPSVPSLRSPPPRLLTSAPVLTSSPPSPVSPRSLRVVAHALATRVITPQQAMDITARGFSLGSSTNTSSSRSSVHTTTSSGRSGHRTTRTSAITTGYPAHPASSSRAAPVSGAGYPPGTTFDLDVLSRDSASYLAAVSPTRDAAQPLSASLSATSLPNDALWSQYAATTAATSTRGRPGQEDSTLADISPSYAAAWRQQIPFAAVETVRAPTRAMLDPLDLHDTLTSRRSGSRTYVDVPPTPPSPRRVRLTALAIQMGEPLPNNDEHTLSNERTLRSDLSVRNDRVRPSDSYDFERHGRSKHPLPRAGIGAGGSERGRGGSGSAAAGGGANLSGLDWSGITDLSHTINTSTSTGHGVVSVSPLLAALYRESVSVPAPDTTSTANIVAINANAATSSSGVPRRGAGGSTMGVDNADAEGRGRAGGSEGRGRSSYEPAAPGTRADVEAGGREGAGRRGLGRGVDVAAALLQRLMPVPTISPRSQRRQRQQSVEKEGEMVARQLNSEAGEQKDSKERLTIGKRRRNDTAHLGGTATLPLPRPQPHVPATTNARRGRDTGNTTTLALASPNTNAAHTPSTTTSAGVAAGRRVRGKLVAGTPMPTSLRSRGAAAAAFGPDGGDAAVVGRELEQEDVVTPPHKRARTGSTLLLTLPKPQ